MKEGLRQLIDDHDVISFDIWDTLIHRRCGKPTGVFFLLQGELANTKEFAFKYPDMVSNFMYLRQEAESAARREMFKNENTHEITIRDIYDVFAEMTGLPLMRCDAIAQMEMQIEQSNLYIDKEMYDALKYAQYRDKHVVLVSDMYLPGDILHKFLVDLGYPVERKQLLISCDLGISKHEGDLFEYVKAKYNNLSIVHIGDNAWSDVTQASNYLIDNYHHQYLFPAVENSFIFDNSPISELIKGLVQATLSDLDEKYHDDFFKVLGITTFGPWMIGFLTWVLERSKHVDHLIFFTRDGRLMTEVAEMMTDRPVHYMGASRAAILKPSLFNMELMKIIHPVNPYVQKTVGDTLRVYGIHDPRQVMDKIQSCGYKDANSVVSDKWQFLRLLITIEPHLQGIAREHVAYVRKYFEDFVGSKLGVVDFGWYATSQYNLTKLLNFDSRTEVDGYYYHVVDHAPGPFSWRASFYDKYHSYLLETVGENEANLAWDNYLHEAGIPVMEAMMSDPVGTVLQYTEDGYEQEDDFYHPQKDKILSLQNGVKLFVKQYLKIKGHDAHFLSYDWMKPFIRLIEFPTIEEAERIGKIEHGAAAGSLGGKTDTLAPKLMNLTQARYEEELKNAQWRQAFMVLNRP